MGIDYRWNSGFGIAVHLPKDEDERELVEKAVIRSACKSFGLVHDPEEDLYSFLYERNDVHRLGVVFERAGSAFYGDSSHILILSRHSFRSEDPTESPELRDFQGSGRWNEEPSIPKLRDAIIKALDETPIDTHLPTPDVGWFSWIEVY